MLVFNGWGRLGRAVSGGKGGSLGFSWYHLFGLDDPSRVFENLLVSSRGVLGA